MGEENSVKLEPQVYVIQGDTTAEVAKRNGVPAEIVIPFNSSKARQPLQIAYDPKTNPHGSLLVKEHPVEGIDYPFDIRPCPKPVQTNPTTSYKRNRFCQSMAQ